MELEAPLILVVDDDPDFLEMHREILESAGYRVASAYDPQGALELFAREQPALVVTDLMMSSLDSGFALSRELSARSGAGRIPVIIVTSVAQRLGYDFTPRSADELNAMCADAYFAKPVQPGSLLEKVRELLHRPGGRDG